MPEFDYGPEDIDYISATIDLHHEPTPHAKVSYVVHLKNGETREDRSGEVHNEAAAECAIAILMFKRDLDLQAAGVEATPRRRSWRDRP
jgi:hypothetical protein